MFLDVCGSSWLDEGEWPAWGCLSHGGGFGCLGSGVQVFKFEHYMLTESFQQSLVPGEVCGSEHLCL